MLARLRALGIQYLRTGWTFKRLLKQLRETQYYSPDVLADYQDAKLRAIIRHCYRHVPYYAETFRELGLTPEDIQTRADLIKLPLIDKHTVQSRFDDFISRRGFRQLAFPGYTSGSTGMPAKFLRDYHFINFENAAVWRYYMTHGYHNHKPRRLVFTGRLIVPIEQKEPPFWIYDKLTNTLVLSSLHLSPANEQAYIEEVLRFRPEVIMGYPSTTYLLAEIFDRHLLTLNIRAVLPGSETVLDYQRETIERVFNTNLYDWYGQQERVAAISQCEHKTYHILEDYSVVELVNLDGYTEIVGTHLENYKMPLLRYRTGDTVLPSETACPCGRHFRTVERVLGRTGQYILTPDGRKITVVNYLMQKFENVREAQFVQDRADALTLKLVASEGFSEENRAAILEASRAFISPSMEINIQVVDTIPRTQGGKFLSVVNHLATSARSPELN